MKLQEKNGMLEMTTNIYQTKVGSVCINFGNIAILLNRKQADEVIYDIPDHDIDSYKKFYDNY